MPDEPTPPPLPGSEPPPPPPSAAEQQAHALVTDHQQTRTYPCTACGGQLEFDIGEQSLKCPHCGNLQEFREVSGPVEEQDLRSALRELRRKAHHDGEATQQVAGEKEVVCQQCGGRTTFTGPLTSTRCPYCATPIQRDDVHEAPSRLHVDGVLPFAVDEGTAKANLEEWVGSRWFAPSAFKNYADAGSFASVYTAYFTFDARADTQYHGERGTHYTVTVGAGEDQRTETKTKWKPASGSVHSTFDDVAVMANEGGLNRGYIAQLEPWPMERVEPFSPEFVAGHLSRTYDRDLEECFSDAKETMAAEIRRDVERDIGGDEQRIADTRTTWSGLTFKHLLLPIWLLTVAFEGQTYQVMINGATGEVIGERPFSKVKIAAAIAAVVVVIAIIVLLVRG